MLRAVIDRLGSYLTMSKLDTLWRRDPGAFAPVDLDLPEPVMDRGSGDAEFNDGSSDVLAGTDERDGSASELDREGSRDG